ncbi:MAG TPA: J domain-containing protein [Xanthobacteraceae bacterium]|nr:J domain-containing protein [Xanthobacteraceae bacterium]
MWDELGIAPCADPKAIRRAYAARLKRLDPDRDPEAFARLRTAFEWALSRAGDDDNARSSATPEFSQPTAAKSSTSPVENAQGPDRGPPVPASDPDDIRDRALLIALDSALRRRDGNEATMLYYRAAATGALGLDGAREVTERLLAVAVDDLTLGAAAFRHLAQTIGVSTRRLRAPVASEVHQRAIARLQAEDWYDDLLATAKQRKGREARHQARIARLLLGRSGRYWSPKVDPAALKTRLQQCRIHAVWLGDRIDPAWLSRLEWRQRRGRLFGLACYNLFVLALLIQFMHDAILEITTARTPSASLVIVLFLAAFLLWLFRLFMIELQKLLDAGWIGFVDIAPSRMWAGRARKIWRRSKAKEAEDAG